jgi:hypothetical protein
MSAADAFDSFLHKWRQRQPEMQLLEAFCPPAERPLLNAWGSLLNELMDSMFLPSEPAVLRTRLGWWAEELAAGPVGCRHPIGRRLLAEPSAVAVPGQDWRRLGGLGIVLAEASAGDAPLDAAALHSLAEALAAIEAQVFGRPSSAATVACAVALDHLQRQPPASAALIERAAALCARLPAPASLALFRGGRLAFDRWRLDRLAEGADLQQVQRLPAARALWLAWRAARRSRAAC